jgi:hypothetical protein
MANPTDQPAPHQTIDDLIVEAVTAPRSFPRRERCAELDHALRVAIGDRYLVVQERLKEQAEYTRGWWRIRNVLDDVDGALAGDLGSGLMSAALHVAELARQTRALVDLARESS